MSQQSPVRLLPTPLARLDAIARAVANWGKGQVVISAPEVAPDDWIIEAEWQVPLFPGGPKQRTMLRAHGATLVEAIDVLYEEGPGVLEMPPKVPVPVATKAELRKLRKRQ